MFSRVVIFLSMRKRKNLQKETREIGSSGVREKFKDPTAKRRKTEKVLFIDA